MYLQQQKPNLSSIVKLMNQQETGGNKNSNVIAEDKKSPVPRSFNIETKFKHYKDSSSSSSSSPQPKVTIDDQISEVLGFPKDVITGSEFWPYTSETLNELIKFKTQQELTKQEIARQQQCFAAVEMMKLAREMNITDLPFATLQNMPALTGVDTSVNTTPTNPNTNTNTMLIAMANPTPTSLPNPSPISLPNSIPNPSPNSLPNSLPNQPNTNSNPLPTNADKRKYSDIHLPSFLETAESIKTFSSTIVSPLRSPNKSPTGHRRIISDSSEATVNTSPPLVKKAGESTLPSATPVYPVYYTGYPVLPQQLSQKLSQHLPQQQQQIPQQLPPPQLPTDKLGSPYSQKYPYPNYYQYYSTSPSSGYVLPPKQQDQVVKKQAVPSHQFETSDRFTVTEDVPSKKRSKSNSINFMITTPKNPPARKYNNPK